MTTRAHDDEALCSGVKPQHLRQQQQEQQQQQPDQQPPSMGPMPNDGTRRVGWLASSSPGQQPAAAAAGAGQQAGVEFGEACWPTRRLSFASPASLLTHAIPHPSSNCAHLHDPPSSPASIPSALCTLSSVIDPSQHPQEQRSRRFQLIVEDERRR